MHGNRLTLAAWLLTAAVSAPGAAAAKQLIVSGEAKFVDGEPIAIGTVYLQELRPRRHRMPQSRLLTLGTTGHDGRFQLETSGVDGDLYIKLIADHCSWLGGQQLIRYETLRSREKIHVVITSERDACAASPP